MFDSTWICITYHFPSLGLVNWSMVLPKLVSLYRNVEKTWYKRVWLIGNCKVMLFQTNLGGSPTLLTTHAAAREWLHEKDASRLDTDKEMLRRHDMREFNWSEIVRPFIHSWLLGWYRTHVCTARQSRHRIVDTLPYDNMLRSPRRPWSGFTPLDAALPLSSVLAAHDPRPPPSRWPTPAGLASAAPSASSSSGDPEAARHSNFSYIGYICRAQLHIP